MKHYLTRLFRFFTTDIWQMAVGGDLRHEHRRGTLWLKTFMVAVRHFYRKNLFMRDVPALTFATLMAIVPVVALIFAIAKMMGSDFYVEEWLRSTFEAQPVVADTLVTFATKYLEHTKSGYIVGVGVGVMLYTVFVLMQKIELAFNKIWHTRKGRSVWRMLVDYSGIFLFLVAMIFISTGMAIVLRMTANTLEGWLHTGSLTRYMLSVVPYVALIMLFFLLFKAVPSVRVHWRTAIVPAIASGVAMAILQFYYFKLQIGLTGYNVIYGSFAALPLFLLWLEFSWAICLLGVELCYAIQNLSQFDYNMQVYDLSHEQHLAACAIVMKHVCQYYADDQRCLTAEELQRASQLPQQLVDYTIQRLLDIDLLRLYRDRHHRLRYTPSTDIYQITVGLLLQRIDQYAVWHGDSHVIRLDSPQWDKVQYFKHEYLLKCNHVLVKDL